MTNQITNEKMRCRYQECKNKKHETTNQIFSFCLLHKCNLVTCNASKIDQTLYCKIHKDKTTNVNAESNIGASNTVNQELNNECNSSNVNEKVLKNMKIDNNNGLIINLNITIPII